MTTQSCNILKDNLILRGAKQKIDDFNRIGLHYNLVASSVYKKRSTCADPFDRSFMQYIIAGLISFDMGRMMGKNKYKMEGNGFGSRLNSKLLEIKPILTRLMNLSLTKIDLQQHKDAIVKAYDNLSANGNGALNENRKEHFHVGATKILHFLNPTLFIIVDSNAAKAFRKAHNVKFRKGTQPGYSSQRYIECMECAQRDILTYKRDHPEGFEALERDTPITRIYDKLTFITETHLRQKRPKRPNA